MDSIRDEDLTTLDLPPFLKQCVGKGKEIPPGNILQVQQITNISFPTYDKPNYDCEKHTLKITVTDGQSQGYAIVADSCPGISLNTPPGTKIRTTQSIPVQGSLFVLNRNNCEVLGGIVAKLYEKWEAQRKHAIKHEWGYTGTAVEGEGPPPWKPFGYKPSIDVAALRKMKTIDVVNENKKDGQAGAAKSQFDMQRDEAISELQATANKQKFSKPNKHLLDKEITDIMEEGFSQTDAEYAMNRFKNTQKAIKFLKESKNRQDGAPREPPKPAMERKDRRSKKSKGNDDDEEQEVPAEYQRPTKSISLFGFIEGQIKTDSKPTAQTNGPSQNHGGRGRDRDLDDGMGRLNIRDSKGDSYSGRGNDRGRGRGYRGGGRGGGGDSFHSHNTQRYDNSSQRYENNSQRHENSSQRYDNSTQRYDNSSHRHDNNSQRYDNSTQRYDNSTQRYDNSSQRYENKGNSQMKNESTQRPPRFQGRGGSDSRPADYHSGGGSSRSNQSSNYDSYKDRGQTKDSYHDSRSYHDTSSSRQEYSGNYPSYQQRPPSGKDRSYSSDYHQQQPPQQQYSKSNDYPVPSQSYQQQNSYQQQQQHQPPQQRQYLNTSSQNHGDLMGHRGGASGQQRTQSHYTNHPSGHPQNPQHPSGGEFTHYQYGYEGYNPSQSLVFTRSKPDNRGRGGGYQGNGRGAPPQNSTYGRNPNSRY